MRSTRSAKQDASLGMVFVFCRRVGLFRCFNLAHAAPVEETLRQSLIRQQLPRLKDLDHLKSYTEDKTLTGHKGNQYGGFRYLPGIPEDYGAMFRDTNTTAVIRHWTQLTMQSTVSPFCMLSCSRKLWFCGPESDEHSRISGILRKTIKIKKSFEAPAKNTQSK